MVILSQISRHARTRPNAVATRLGEQFRTYRELACRAEAFGAFLLSFDCGRSGRRYLENVRALVALDVGNCIEFAELFAASTRWPFACILLDGTMKHAQIEEVLSRLQPDLVIARDDGVAGAAACGLGLHVLFLSELASLYPFPSGKTAREASDEADAPFLVTFTSGTTSSPKAILRSRKSWLASLERSATHFRLSGGTSTFCPGSLVHGMAIYAMMETLHAGGSFSTLETWDANLAADTIRSGSINRIVVVPTMLTAIVRTAAANACFTSVEAVLTAGEKLGPDHLADASRLFPRASIQEYYGASELGFVTASIPRRSGADENIDSVGTPFPGVDIRIRDKNGKDVEHGETGTIHVRSDLVCDGYLWGDDGRAFRTDGVWSTVGDLGRLRANGELQVLGREGGMITTGGYNVYPSEIEQVLRTIPGIADALVLAIADSYLGTRLVAVYLSATLDEGQVREKIFLLLPKYKCPRRFYRLQSWPLTRSGKAARGRIERDLINGKYDRV